VPSLFQDNFDYGDIRRDFVHGVLTSDLLMKSIHLYVAQEGYAARVSDTRSYESIRLVPFASKLSPIVLTTSPVRISCQGGPFRSFRMTIIRVATTTSTAEEIATLPKTVLLSWPGMWASHNTNKSDFHILSVRTCKIGTSTLIGSSTMIAEQVQVISSVIGRNCVIGTGTVIDNSYIFDDTIVGPNCKIQRSIIGYGCSIKENTRVSNGSLIGDGVVIGPNVMLSPFERLSAQRDPANDDSDEIDSDLEDVERG